MIEVGPHEDIISMVHEAIDIEVGHQREQLRVETEWAIERIRDEIQRVIAASEPPNKS